MLSLLPKCSGKLGATIKKLFMKNYSTNYAIRILGLTLIAFMAILKPAFCQTNWLDYALENWVVSVSPDQQVKFRFPKDIRNGDMITGSVIEEKKNNSGEVNKASSTLEGVVIEIDGKQTKISNRLISFLVPAGITSLPFLLKNSAGEIIERGQIPLGVFSHFDNNATISGATFKPESVCQPGQLLTINGNFDGNAANTNVSLNGWACEIIAESPRMSYVQVPEEATAGVFNLSIKENNITEEHKVNVAVLNLTANKTNLLKGEKTTLKVTVNGLEGLAAEQMSYKLNVENQSPQTISFLKESGNVIVRDINTASVKNGKYEFSTKIIAQSSGPFSVQAVFFKPVSKNPCVDDYYDCVKNADDVYESKSKKCVFTATGNKRIASTCQAVLIKEREESKAACLQALINCMKNMK